VQVVAGLALFLVFPNVATFAIGFVLVAGGQHGLALVTHEFTHYLVFPKRRKLNDVIGAWFFAGPSGLAFDLYRHRHFAHHRLYSTEDDTKTLYKRDYTGGRLLLECVRSLCGLDYIQQVVNVLRRLGKDKRDPGARTVSLRRAMVPLVGSQFVIAAILCLMDPVVYVMLWAVPLLTLTQLFSKLRSSVEHLPLNCESGEDPNGKYYKGTSGPVGAGVAARAPVPVEGQFLLPQRAPPVAAGVVPALAEAASPARRA
jgi:fatty acid desaturase